jgi:hypothetical protein
LRTEPGHLAWACQEVGDWQAFMVALAAAGLCGSDQLVKIITSIHQTQSVVVNAGAGMFGAAYGAGGHDSGLPDMPAGVDLEEARMLEAAMLGIPYAGRLPDFGVNGAAPPGGGGFGGGAAQPLSPGVRHTRALREEQDWAFQASLQVLSPRRHSCHKRALQK